MVLLAVEATSNEFNCWTACSNDTAGTSAAVQDRPPSSASTAIGTGTASFVALQTALVLFTLSSHSHTIGLATDWLASRIRVRGSIKHAEAERSAKGKCQGNLDMAILHFEIDSFHCETRCAIPRRLKRQVSAKLGANAKLSFQFEKPPILEESKRLKPFSSKLDGS